MGWRRGADGDGDVRSAVATADGTASSPEGSTGISEQRFGLELLAVLGVSYGMLGITSLLRIIRDQVEIQKGFGLSNVATGPIKTATNTVNFQWLDILDQVASVLQGLAPAFLAIVLLMRSPGGPGLGIGLRRPGGRDLAQGAGFAALIGLPGLAFVYVARELGLNAQIVVTNFPDVWYRVPTLIVEAFQQGISEEVVVCAYILVRLHQMGWTRSRSLATAAVIRGSYHLYQGFGGFVGNAIMSLVFGWWFQRTRRVWPLVIAHSIIDAVSFVGYIYLKDHVSWL